MSAAELPPKTFKEVSDAAMFTLRHMNDSLRDYRRFRNYLDEVILADLEANKERRSPEAISKISFAWAQLQLDAGTTPEEVWTQRANEFFRVFQNRNY